MARGTFVLALVLVLALSVHAVAGCAAGDSRSKGHAPSPAAPARAAAPPGGHAWPDLSRSIRGNQTATEELDRWPRGEPYDTRLRELKADAKGWQHAIAPGAWHDDSGRCEPVRATTRGAVLQEASTDVLAKALAGYLGGDARRLGEARAHLLELAATTGFDRADGGRPFDKGNQCVLDLSISVWHLVEAAALLEAAGDARWTRADKWALQDWLDTQVFPRLTWAAENAANNWGPLAESASLAVADYLDGHRASLTKHDGTQVTPRAWMSGLGARLARFASTKTALADSTCHEVGASFGWRASGALPDELRRGSSRRPVPSVAALCDAPDLSLVCRSACRCGAGLTYQQKATVGLVRVAEFERRKLGGTSLLYDRTPAPSIRDAIEFVTKDALGCVVPEAVSGLGFVAAGYYRDAAMAGARRQGEPGVRGGRDLAYGAITHADGIAYGRADLPAGR